MLCVGLEIIGHLIFCRKPVAPAGECQTRQSIVTSGREQPERVPTVPPGVSSSRIGIDDHEGHSPFCQVIPHCKSCLPAAYHKGLDALGFICCIHSAPL